MKQKRSIRQFALLLALVYLFSSGWMTLRTEGHILNHEAAHHHGAQHASFVCAWMCAASTFVHSPDQRLSPSFHLSFEAPALSEERFHHAFSVFSFHIRPPPSSL
jgi:hypothetical protein